MKTIEQVLMGIGVAESFGDLSASVSGLTADSRQVAKGSLFVAVPGTVCDGHDFISKAVSAGASAVLCSRMPVQRAEGVAYIRVDDAADALGRAASNWFGNPSRSLRLVGVTGTNGKTTTATLLYQLFSRLGHKCGLLSTVENRVGEAHIKATHTTPDPVELNGLLSQMVQQGCDYAFMEVSSHAAHQKRIAGLVFAGGVFTNITRDHLDYHKTFDNYLRAKKSFFDSLPQGAFALTNADDKNGLVMLQNTRARRATYSARSSSADFSVRVVDDSFEGLSLETGGRSFEVPFVGRFNALNLMAVYGAAVLLGADRDEVLVALTALHPVCGRFEAMRSPRGYTAIVDYAHTPDALENVLGTVNEVLRGRADVITVCGAGGNRDKGKRPLMAQTAANNSDTVILTSDNPRDEEPQDIINDMLLGLDAGQRGRTIVITDRREAIHAACRMAKRGDVVLVAGKGHEDYQEVKGVKHHFDDHEVLSSIFSNE